MTTQNRPKAVCISDIHYNLSNLPLADAALRQAIVRAGELRVPLFILGDLHDSKALLRAECVNTLITTFTGARRAGVEIYLLIGNHDLINEKGAEHSLNFLEPYCTIIRSGPVQPPGLSDWFIPYQSDPAVFAQLLAEVPIGSTVFCHQGISDSDMGHYVHDKSAVDKSLFSDYRAISGHYHRAQDIKCGRPRKGAIGLFSYLGSPYTQSFAEASDADKGFSVLMSNGILERCLTDLRRHRLLEYTTEDVQAIQAGWQAQYSSADLLWVKIIGPQSELSKIDKEILGQRLQGHSNFKLDKIPTDSEKPTPKATSNTAEQLMDQLIDCSSESEEHCDYLKSLWREILDETRSRKL